MKRQFLWTALGVLLLLALTTTVAWAAPALQEGDENLSQDALWIALTPLLAMATSIERIMESIWDRWEWFYGSNTGDDKSAKSRIKKFLLYLMPDPAGQTYIPQKKLWSHWMGTILAVIGIAFTNIRFFRLMNLDTNLLFGSSQVLFDLGIGGIFDDFTLGTLVDWIATSLVIGWGGTELTHSIIEGLVKGRNLWKEMKEVQEGKRAITDVELYKNYVAPQLEELGLSQTAVRQAFKTLDSAGVSVDKIIADLTIGKANQLMTELSANTETKAAAQSLQMLLQGAPAAMGTDPVNLGKAFGKAIDKIPADVRQRFLGA